MEDRTEAFAGHLRGQMLSALELSTIALGLRLGLYGTLGDGRGRTAPGLADETALAERYVREWLEQQAVAGLLEVDRPEAPPSERRFPLPGEHATVLLDPTARGYAAASVISVASLPLELEDVAEVFRTGAGLAWHEIGYPDDVSRDANRAVFEHDLASWIAAIPRLHDRLSDRREPAPSPTSGAVAAGRASRWPPPTPACGSTGWTRTPRRSSWRAGMHASRGPRTA